MDKRTILRTPIIFLLILLLVHTTIFSQSKIKKVSGPVPEFTMTSVEGEIIPFNNLKGKVIMLEFWDTHCGPCRKLMPDLEKLTANYANNKNVEIYSVNGGFESVELAKKYINKYKYNLQFTFMNKKVSRGKLKVRELPCTIIIDKNQNYHYMHVGLNEEKEQNIIMEFDRKIQEALKK